jgi:hypothetical protein
MTSPQHYVSSGKVLQNPLRIQSESNPEKTLSGTGQPIQTGPRLSIPFWYNIHLKQKVEGSDASLGTDRKYRIVITFEASQT